jgi:glycogen(starch) synthase
MPHAICVDFWDVASLAGSICSILNYKSLSRTLKKNSRSHTKKVTWDKAAEKVIGIYKDVASRL